MKNFYNNTNDNYNYECDGDCDNCSMACATLDDVLGELSAMHFDMLLRNAYDIGLIDKDEYSRILGRALLTFAADFEEGSDAY